MPNSIKDVLPKLRPWIPLAAAALALLLALPPLARVPGIAPYVVKADVYQLPALQLLQFLIFPLALAAIWAMRRWVKGFEAMENGLLLGASALQVVSLLLLSAHAGELLRRTLTQDLLIANADDLPQRLGAGFWLLLGLAVLCFVYAGFGLVGDVRLSLMRRRVRRA